MAMNMNISRRGFCTGAGLALMGLAACSSSNGTSSSASAAADTSSSANSSLNLVTDGKLTSVSDMANPPFSYYDKGSKEPKGFEVDLMAAIAEEMGLESTWLDATKFDTIIPLIKQGGKADLGVSNITITAEREKEIAFSDPYIDSNLGVVTKADSTETTQEALNAAGKKVAAQAGTTGEAWAQENLVNATVVALDDPVQALTGVQAGQYDAACADLPVVKYLCTTSYTDLSVAIEIPTGDQYGMAVSKGNKALLDAVNEALQAVIDSGKRDEIETKWFGSTL
jgi:ABC-type amino acid transport substrate-binding protein